MEIWPKQTCKTNLWRKPSLYAGVKRSIEIFSKTPSSNCLIPEYRIANNRTVYFNKYLCNTTRSVSKFEFKYYYIFRKHGISKTKICSFDLVANIESWRKNGHFHVVICKHWKFRFWENLNNHTSFADHFNQGCSE